MRAGFFAPGQGRKGELTLESTLHNLPQILNGRPGCKTQSRADGVVYGALDLGSNNCRLLVARPEAEGFRVIDAFSRIVRLGEGVSETGLLSDAAMDRTLSALSVCAKKLRQREVTRFRGVATEACRLATNCDMFTARATEETGVELEIISSFEEVELALHSCAPLLLGSASHALLFDIGGCSTELIWVSLKGGTAPKLVDWTSLSCGVVSLAERHGGDRISPDIFESMVAEAAAMVEPFVAVLGIQVPLAGGSLQLLGTSGTVTTIAGLHQGLKRYDRAKVDGFLLDFDAIRHEVNRLLQMDFDGRAAEPCIGTGRGDVVVAGCAILEAILRACPAETVHVADRGLREGMLLKMMQADKFSV